MSDHRIRRLLLAVVCVFAAVVGLREAAAGDCCRQMGIGYGAGYNAPAAYAQPSSLSKWGGWLHWKSACCQPGAAPAGCGCGPVAPSCCPTPCCPQPCCPNMGPRHPGIY